MAKKGKTGQDTRALFVLIYEFLHWPLRDRLGILGDLGLLTGVTLAHTEGDMDLMWKAFRQARDLGRTRWLIGALRENDMSQAKAQAYAGDQEQAAIGAAQWARTMAAQHSLRINEAGEVLADG